MFLSAANAEAADSSASLRLTADAPGVVRLRGDGVLGVDWPAGGAGNVSVPVTIYETPADGFSLSINGRPAAFDRPTIPPAGFDDDAYQRAIAWTPGRSDAARRWTLLATAVIVLSLGVAAFIDPKRATRWTVLTAVGLGGGVVLLFPVDVPRREVSVPGTPGAEWVWRAGRVGDVVEEPWRPGMQFVARSAGHLREADPVLVCDAGGWPVTLQCRITDGGRAVFIRSTIPKSHSSQ